jgi:hypothetical protein
MPRLTPYLAEELQKALFHGQPSAVLRAARMPAKQAQLRQCGDAWLVALHHRDRTLFDQLVIWKADPNLPMATWPTRHVGGARHMVWTLPNSRDKGPCAWTHWMVEHAKHEPALEGPWSTRWLLEQGFSPTPADHPIKDWPLTVAVKNEWSDTVGAMLHHCRDLHHRWPDGVLEQALFSPSIYQQLWEAGARPSPQLEHWKDFFEHPAKLGGQAETWRTIAGFIAQRLSVAERRTRRSHNLRSNLPKGLVEHYLPKMHADPDLGWALWQSQRNASTDWKMHVLVSSPLGDERLKSWRPRMVAEGRWNPDIRCPVTGDTLLHVFIRDIPRTRDPSWTRTLSAELHRRWEENPDQFSQGNRSGQTPWALIQDHAAQKDASAVLEEWSRRAERQALEQALNRHADSRAVHAEFQEEEPSPPSRRVRL